MNEEVRKAVERLREIAHRDEAKGVTVRADDLRVALAHLLAREAEVERLNAAWDSSFKQAMLNGQSAQEQRARAERAEALLRETWTIVLELCNCYAHPCPQATIERITAHLSENSRG